jgi:hypothetical protein
VNGTFGEALDHTPDSGDVAASQDVESGRPAFFVSRSLNRGFAGSL